MFPYLFSGSRNGLCAGDEAVRDSSMCISLADFDIRCRSALRERERVCDTLRPQVTGIRESRRRARVSVLFSVCFVALRGRRRKRVRCFRGSDGSRAKCQWTGKLVDETKKEKSLFS